MSHINFPKNLQKRPQRICSTYLWLNWWRKGKFFLTETMGDLFILRTPMSRTKFCRALHVGLAMLHVHATCRNPFPRKSGSSSCKLGATRLGLNLILVFFVSCVFWPEFTGFFVGAISRKSSLPACTKKQHNPSEWKTYILQRDLHWTCPFAQWLCRLGSSQVPPSCEWAHWWLSSSRMLLNSPCILTMTMQKIQKQDTKHRPDKPLKWLGFASNKSKTMMKKIFFNFRVLF